MIKRSGILSFLLNPYPATIFVLEISSAFTSAAYTTSALQIRFFPESKLYGPFRLLQKEQSDLGPYGLQYRLSVNISRR